MNISGLYPSESKNGEAAMGYTSHIPELLKKKGWDLNTFRGQCIMAGLSDFTAMRLANGETNFSMATLETVAQVLGVKSISQLIEFNNGEHKAGR